MHDEFLWRCLEAECERRMVDVSGPAPSERRFVPLKCSSCFECMYYRRGPATPTPRTT